MADQTVVHTTFSSRAVADFVSAAFPVPVPLTARLVSRGFNDVYEIEPARLFLRLGRQARRTLVDAEFEGRALAEANAAGAPVAVALRGRDGRFAQSLAAPEGERAALLLAAAPGVDAEDTPGHAQAQGRALARLHEVVLTPSTARGLRRLDIETLVNAPAERAATRLPDAALAARVRQVAAGLGRHLEAVQAGLSVGLCHGDCHGYNATVDNDAATLLDFDELGIGWLAYDLATFLRTCQFSSADKRALLWASFIRGYREVRTPRPADLDAVEALVIARELWTFGAWAEGATHWGDRWFRSVHAARRIEQFGEQFERLLTPRLA
jgi:Ser/Thr protein kinase RdoA (MazF antagonist)